MGLYRRPQVLCGTRLSEHAQFFRFVFLGNQICHVCQKVHESGIPGIESAQRLRFLVLSHKWSAVSWEETDIVGKTLVFSALHSRHLYVHHQNFCVTASQ